MDMVGGAAADMKKKAAEAAISKCEEQFGTMLPAPLKMFNPCCGGPMGTLKAFECVVPADQKESFQSGYEKYESAKKELAE